MKPSVFIAAMLGCALLGCNRDAPPSNAQLLREQQRNKNAASVQPKTVEEEIELAEEQLVNGNIDLAEASVRKLLISQPENPRVILLAAACQAARGENIAAAETLRAIDEKDPAIAIVALNQAAQWLIEADRLDLAHERLQRVLEIEGETNRIRHQLAQVLNNQGRRIEARTHLRALVRSGDATEKELVAMNCFAEPFIDLTLPPPTQGDGMSMSMLAKAKAERIEGNLQTARMISERLRDQFPDARQVAAFQGRIYADLQLNEALIQWSKSLPEGIDREPEYWHALGTWLQHQGEHKQAIRCFAEAVAIDDTDRFSYLALAQSLAIVGQDEQAAIATERFNLLVESAGIAAEIGQAPGTPEQLERMAEIMDRLHRPWEAVAWREVAARTYGATERQRQSLRARREQLAATTIPSNDDNWQTCGVALADWPLPATDAIQVHSDSQTDQYQLPESRPIRLSDVAAKSSFDFSYLSGADPDDKEVLLHQLTGGGIGVIDFDLDGWPDLYMTQGGGDAYDASGSEANALFQNISGRQFDKVGSPAGVGDLGYGQGVAVADLNQDGFADMVVANIGPNVLYLNNGDGTFRRELLAGDSPAGDDPAANQWTTSIACGDLDGDRLPEVVEVNYVDDPTAMTTPCVDNQGICNPSRFRPASDRILWSASDGRYRENRRGFDTQPSYGFAAIIANLDKQAGNDLFIVNDAKSNGLWLSEISGGEISLTECGQVRGCASGLQGARNGCMGIAAGDFDQNGWIDFHVTNFWDQPADLYLQQADGLFVNATVPYGVHDVSRRTVGWGTQAVDFDRDGWLDVAVLNGHLIDQPGIPYRMRPQLFRGLPDRWELLEFDRSGDRYWSTKALGRTMAVLDWNRDGRPDLVTNHLHTPAALLENETEIANWIQLELVGSQCERDAIGAEVTVHCRQRKWTGWVTGGDGLLCSNESFLDFGVGTATKIDRIEIVWPGGRTQSFDDLPCNRRFLVTEGEPELFAR